MRLKAETFNRTFQSQNCLFAIPFCSHFQFQKHTLSPNRRRAVSCLPQDNHGQSHNLLLYLLFRLIHYNCCYSTLGYPSAIPRYTP